jgi:hypothetical protein
MGRRNVLSPECKDACRAKGINRRDGRHCTERLPSTFPVLVDILRQLGFSALDRRIPIRQLAANMRQAPPESPGTINQPSTKASARYNNGLVTFAVSICRLLDLDSVLAFIMVFYLSYCAVWDVSYILLVFQRQISC